MPGFDGTGPGGGGPMTGGGRGYCNPAGSPGYGYGRGFGGGRGFGRGRGFRGGFGAGAGRGYGWGYARGAYPPAWGGSYGPYDNPAYNMGPEQELNMLKGDAEAIKNELDAVNKRIQDLEAKSPEA